MSQDATDETRKQLLQVLLDTVADDQYPSTTMLDLIEELLTPEEVPAYANVLLEKIRNERFPSTAMMARLRDLT